jgi:hypothetical protein
MTMDGPVVALAFTPDGAFLASATTQQILIWKLDDISFPRARWVLGPQHSLGSNGMWAGSDVDEHCLSWDTNGQKLAYGINNNVRPLPHFGIPHLQVIVGRDRMETNSYRPWTLRYCLTIG